MLMSKKQKALISNVCASVLLTAVLAGCSAKNTSDPSDATDNVKETTPYKITFMTNTYSGDPIKDDSPIMKKIEEYTNVDLQMNWVPSSSYNDKVNITLVSGNMPMVMLVNGKPSSIISAARNGAFWEVGPYLKDYPNLKQANPNVLNNISIDGKVYGIYRSRAYGRNGIIFRKDWLKNVGMSEPKTIDDFYKMLKAFTENDPDKNGKNDTFGMAVSKYKGPFDVTSIWFGAPNKWGEDKDGKLVADFTTPEYMENLKFWKKLYDEKLINQDFAVLDPTKWPDLLNTGKAGVIVDVLDQGQRSDEAITKADPNKVDTIDVMGAVEGPKGLRNLPTSGYNGMFVFSKQAIKTEKDLKRVLAFMDKLNDKDVQVLVNNGIEGRQYKLENGYAVPLKDPNIPLNEINDINQIMSYIPETRSYLPKQTPVIEKVGVVQKENEKIAIPNPAEPFISKTYSTKGAQLDNIIEDARVKFIVGQTDEAGFKAAIELWKKSGGDAVTKEMNEEYAKYKKK